MKWLAALIPLLFLAACAPSTPAARIAAQPQAFLALPEKHQKLVRQGRIEQGMREEAVALAWGSPGRRYDGHDGTTRTSRWDYTGSRPVVLQQWGGIYGRGLYGRGFCGPDPWVFGPDVVFVPYRRASVWFNDGRVTQWERMH
jgi:hypothetical protein